MTSPNGVMQWQFNAIQRQRMGHDTVSLMEQKKQIHPFWQFQAIVKHHHPPAVCIAFPETLATLTVCLKTLASFHWVAHAHWWIQKNWFNPFNRLALAWSPKAPGRCHGTEYLFIYPSRHRRKPKTTFNY